MIDYCESAILIRSASLRPLHFQGFGNLEIFRGATDQIDYIATKNHLLLRETIAEELFKGDAGTVAENVDLTRQFKDQERISLTKMWNTALMNL
jgi:hypothetical protein